MAERSVKRQKPQKKAVAEKTAVKKTTAKKAGKKTAKKPAPNTQAEQGARIVILTGDPHRHVEILPGCHLDSLGRNDNAYYFEDGNELVGMIVEGGTVEYHAADRTYVVRLTDGHQSDK